MRSHSAIRQFLFLFFILFLCFYSKVSAQTDSINEPIHEITISVFPSLMPLDWESPSSLYKSTKKCYLKTILVPDNYLIGHIVVAIRTPLLPKPIWVAMTAAGKQERIDLVLKKKIGLAVMGAPLNGRIEPEEQITRRLEIYAKRNKLAFITYRVNETAAKRMIEFLSKFTEKNVDGKASCDFYGGAFWPHYRNEGSGCSAFAMTMLELNNLLGPESTKWYVEVNLPMDLIGGDYNQGKKIKNRSIYKTKKWHNGEGIENVDFVKHKIFEPSIIFQWILNERTQANSAYLPIEKESVPGLYSDKRNVVLPADEPIFIDRPKSDIFIENYFTKRRQLDSIIKPKTIP